MIDKTTLQAQKLFHLFVTWKKLSMNDIKEKLDMDLLEILQLLDYYVTNNIITIKRPGPIYSLSEEDYIKEFVDDTIIYLKKFVHSELDKISLLLAENWQISLNKWEDLQNWAPIIQNYFYKEGKIIKNALYEKAKKELKI
ncbi:MAG: hypothetical protein ACXAC7_01615 [Candidatus Hodarchaeales archaeon]